MQVLSNTKSTHHSCIHDKGTFPLERPRGQYTVDERLRNSGRHKPAGLQFSHTPAHTHANDF